MRLDEFDYELPEDLIAQEPIPHRDHSRLLVVERQSGRWAHHTFADLPALLPRDTVLVFNDTRVIPARLRGRKESGGKIEVLLLRRLPGVDEEWEVLCRGGQNVRTGTRVFFAAGLQAEWQSPPQEGRGVLRFLTQGDFLALLEQVGEVPLPPYIKRSAQATQEDRERYQTVYASRPGAIAAPTAGLHFTQELLQTLQRQGVETLFVTLHVGIGTFQPVRVEHVEQHRMETEEYEISAEVAQRINHAKASGRKVVAVGTTSTRALEAAALPSGEIVHGRRSTDLFIYPGYRFRVIDGLITNFHLPRSTLLLLVSAFAGWDVIARTYAEAIAQRYRFYSYGDAMLIL
ncbi:MAG: tRNA preQ1(34) S-adenosylmethionine ribosyltransferase-isomerase QueA [Candidatus Binatia bacterium]|nr:tRNA preQ1(34) S-adenosylmethionine ribosyltransferase-isomerase QueA [Candidatus Binatia bacterium]